jgi:hypothetical protein
MKIQITSNDGNNSNITHTTSITNVTGLSMMVGGVKVDIMSLVQKHIGKCKERRKSVKSVKMNAPLPMLPYDLVMKIRQDASDMSELEARNAHKRVFGSTLEFIEDIQGNTYVDLLMNLSRFHPPDIIEAWDAYERGGAGSRKLSDMIEEYIIYSMNLNYNDFSLVSWVYDYDKYIEEHERWDRMMTKRQDYVHISPSAIHRKNEWYADV